MTKVVEVKVPRGFIEALGFKDVEGLERHSRLVLAVESYMEGRVSLGKAAELAGVSYDDFWDFLKDRGLKIRAGPKSIEEAEREYRAAQEHLKK